MSFAHLSEPQARQAEELYKSLREATDRDLRAIAALLASKPDNQLFGETEFELRGMVHRIGARALETAAEQRKKRGM